MDRMLYVAMTGAKQTMLAQAANTNNLANANTTGFRADFAAFRSMPVFGPGHPSRAYSMTERPGTDFEAGPINATGRNLDVAIRDKGFLAVQGVDGTEGYTRSGYLRVSDGGLLTTASGLPVIGDGGPISIPPASDIQIASDGTVSILPEGAEVGNEEVVARIKLVNPDETQLFKGLDGLIRQKNGEAAPADAQVRVVTGSLEGSNVNISEALVNMIDLARHYEMQVKMMNSADKNAESTSQLMRLS